MTHPYAALLKIASNRIAKWKMAGPLGAPDRSSILMFHDIVAQDAPLPDEYACPFGLFCQIIDAYRARGFSFVTLDELLDAPAHKVRSKLAVITFDDGFSSLATLAAPYLTAAGIPFTAYITTGYLGRAGYLTKEQVGLLAGNPLCTIGSHLVSHPMTRFLSRSETMRELCQSRSTLEGVTGLPVRHMAFPYGSVYACSLRDVRLAIKCGYRSAALTTPTAYERFRLYRDHSLPRLNMPAQFRP